MHLPTKNTTIRLDEEMIEEVDDLCKEKNCTRNDYIKNAIENKLELDSTMENEENSPGPGGNTTPKEEPKPKEPQKIFIDLTQDEKPKEIQNARIVLEPELTAEVKPPNNPALMRYINGQWQPYATRYEV